MMKHMVYTLIVCLLLGLASGSSLSTIQTVDASDVEYVAPSGNITTDTANLQAAIDRLVRPRSEQNQGKLVLSGRYWLNKPLRVGDPAARTVCIEGISQTQIIYYGPKTDEPMLSFVGTGLGRFPRLTQVVLRCESRCRGVAMQDQQYQLLAQDVEILDARQLALKLERCWGSTLERVAISRGRGVLVFVDSGQQSFRDCHFTGRAGDWPAEIPVLQRAAAVIRAGTQLWDNCMWEACKYNGLPLIYVTGPLVTFTNTRFEDNVSRCKWLLEGTTPGNGKACRFMQTHMWENVKPESVLELRGQTRRILVDGIVSTPLATAVVHAAAGTHQDVRVDGALTWYAADPTYPMTATSNGAVITAPPIPAEPLIGDCDRSTN